MCIASLRWALRALYLWVDEGGQGMGPSRLGRYTAVNANTRRIAMLADNNSTSCTYILKQTLVSK